MNASQDLLSVTAFFSALFHAVIILGVSFKLPEIANVENTDNTLDVVLINNNNNLVPEDAETVSTANNEGGGTAESSATSPLPFKAVNAAPVESIKLTANRQAQTTLSPDQLLTAPDGAVAVQLERPEETVIEQPEEQRGKDKISTKSLRQLERERLVAKLSREWADYQKRPKKDFLSPRSKKNEAAQYLDDWRKRVEKIGNANYPIQAKARELSGSLIVSVEINRNGTIAAINVTKPSPHKILNDAAVRFVREASPYPGFPDEIDPDTDILVITRAFHFLSNNRLSSSDASDTL